MSVDAITHATFPEGYTVFFGADGKIIMTPQSEEHSSTIRSMQLDSHPLGRHAKVISDVYIDFPQKRTPHRTSRSCARTPSRKASATASTTSC